MLPPRTPTMARRRRSSATSTAGARATSRRTTRLRSAGISGRVSSARRSPSRAGKALSHASAGQRPQPGKEGLGHRRPPEFVVPTFENFGQAQARIAESLQPDGPAVRLNIGARALGRRDEIIAARIEGQTVVRHQAVVPPPVVDEHLALDIAESDHGGWRVRLAPGSLQAAGPERRARASDIVASHCSARAVHTSQKEPENMKIAPQQITD